MSQTWPHSPHSVRQSVLRHGGEGGVDLRHPTNLRDAACISAVSRTSPTKASSRARDRWRAAPRQSSEIAQESQIDREERITGLQKRLDREGA